MSFQKPITIGEVIKNLNSTYYLPSIQREFIWDAGKIEKLFDSLMRDFPVGSFLFWKISEKIRKECNFYEFINEFDGNNTHNRMVERNKISKRDVKEGKIIGVLDGQQRLTALNIGLCGCHRGKELYLRMQDWQIDESTGVKYKNFSFLNLNKSKDRTEIEEGQWFPVKIIYDDFINSKEVGKYVKKHFPCEDKKLLKERQDHVKKLFNMIHKKALINYYEEPSGSSIERALKIFIRVNRGGKALEYSDLLLSITISHWEKETENTQEREAPHWQSRNNPIRKEIHEFVDEINKEGEKTEEAFRFNKDFVLKSGLVLIGASAKFNVENFIKINQKEKMNNVNMIKENWNDIKHAIKTAVKFLTNFGFNGQSLTTNNAVIPIAQYIFLMKNNKSFLTLPKYDKDRKNIHEWLTHAIIKKSFGGSSDTTLNSIAKIIRKNEKKERFPIDQLKLAKDYPRFSSEDIEDLLKTKYKDKQCFAILSILQKNAYKFNQKFDKDHIVPKSLFTEDNENYNSVNLLPNLVLLESKTNQSKGNKMPNEWIEEHQPLLDENDTVDKKKLKNWKKDHFMPDSLPSDVKEFRKFYDTREKKLRAKLTKILIGKK